MTPGSNSAARRWLTGLQWVGVATLLAGLPLGNVTMSVPLIWLAALWILWRIYYYRTGERDSVLQRYASDRRAWLFSSLYLVFLVSLLWSADLAYGLKDLKTKLPILVFPLIMAGMEPVDARTVRQWWMLLLASLAFAVTVCLTVYTGHYNSFAAAVGWKTYTIHNIREISILISHIRFSLLLVFGLALLVFLPVEHAYGRWLRLALAAYFLFFLWLIESMTGFAILALLLFAWLVLRIWRSRRPVVRIASAVLLVVAVTGSVAYFALAYRSYFTVAAGEDAPLAAHTPRGEAYVHHTDNHQLENGHYIMRYIAWMELSDAWEQRSAIRFESTDARGNPVKGTLIRYLASRGLRKDADGVAALSDEEIRRIEEGVTSCCDRDHHGLRRRLDKIFYEYDAFRNGAGPSGHSVFQRLEFWRAALFIIRAHPLTGVGTGDVRTAFREAYVAMDSPLDENHRLRAHQQYLTVWISSGVFALLWFVGVLGYLLRDGWKRTDRIFIAFLAIAILSFLTEDTLETQPGVSFFVFLSTFLLFHPHRAPGAA